jgi:hypothetical protein
MSNHELIALLQEIEWKGCKRAQYDACDAACPCCGGEQPHPALVGPRGHKEGCKLREAIDSVYRGERMCSDCCTMTHCATHNKVEDTYPD